MNAWASPPPRVLLVDDDARVRRWVQAALEGMDLQLVNCADVDEARRAELEIFGKHCAGTVYGKHYRDAFFPDMTAFVRLRPCQRYYDQYNSRYS